MGMGMCYVVYNGNFTVLTCSPVMEISVTVPKMFSYLFIDFMVFEVKLNTVKNEYQFINLQTKKIRDFIGISKLKYMRVMRVIVE